MLSANEQSQIKWFGVIFVIDSIVRCISIWGFTGSKYGLMGMIAVFIVSFSFFIYTLSQIKLTVEMLYEKRMFYFSPWWSVVVQFLFGHGFFGFILPTFVLIQAQKYEQLSSSAFAGSLHDQSAGKM